MQALADPTVPQYARQLRMVIIHERETPDVVTAIQYDNRELISKEIISKMNGSADVIVHHINEYTGQRRRRKHAVEDAYDILRQFESLSLPSPPVRDSVPLQIAKLLHLKK